MLEVGDPVEVAVGHAEPGVDPQGRTDDVGVGLTQGAPGRRAQHSVDQVTVGQGVFGEGGARGELGRGNRQRSAKGVVVEQVNAAGRGWKGGKPRSMGQDVTQCYRGSLGGGGFSDRRPDDAARPTSYFLRTQTVGSNVGAAPGCGAVRCARLTADVRNEVRDRGSR